jgi:hypothetical protein
MDVLLERRRISSMRTLSVIFCSVLVALVGCGGSSKTATVTGTLTFAGGAVSPTHPHVAPLSGRVILVDSGRQTVAAQEMESGQTYRFQVAPNSYRLVLVPPGGGHLCGIAVRVEEDQTVNKSLNCQIP